MKALLIAILGVSLALVSCGRAHSLSTNTTVPSSGELANPSETGASISVSPNPVPSGDQSSEATVMWNLGSDQIGQVYVSKNGGAEKLFATGRSGSKQVDWMSANTRYEFRLYEGKEHKKLLSNVQVGHTAK